MNWRKEDNTKLNAQCYGFVIVQLSQGTCAGNLVPVTEERQGL